MLFSVVFILAVVDIFSILLSPKKVDRLLRVIASVTGILLVAFPASEQDQLIGTSTVGTAKFTSTNADDDDDRQSVYSTVAWNN